MAEDLKLIFQSQTPEEGIEKAKQTVKKWYVAEPKATASLRFNSSTASPICNFPEISGVELEPPIS